MSSPEVSDAVGQMSLADVPDEASVSSYSDNEVKEINERSESEPISCGVKNIHLLRNPRVMSLKRSYSDFGHNSPSSMLNPMHATESKRRSFKRRIDFDREVAEHVSPKIDKNRCSQEDPSEQRAALRQDEAAREYLVNPPSILPAPAPPGDGHGATFQGSIPYETYPMHMRPQFHYQQPLCVPRPYYYRHHTHPLHHPHPGMMQGHVGDPALYYAYGQRPTYVIHQEQQLPSQPSLVMSAMAVPSTNMYYQGAELFPPPSRVHQNVYSPVREPKTSQSRAGGHHARLKALTTRPRTGKGKHHIPPEIEHILKNASNRDGLGKIKGHVRKLATCQRGCRYLQTLIKVHGWGACKMMLQELKLCFAELIVDPFGNYLFQRIIEKCTERSRRLILVDILQGKVNIPLGSAAMNIHGTRCVQKLIQVCAGDTKAQEIIVRNLGPSICEMSLDTNGNHVVQSFLKHMPGEPCQFIYDSMISDILVLSRHRHGCCVFQRCIDAATATQRTSLIQETIKNATKMCKDPFGNYVVQYVMERCSPEELESMLSKLRGRLDDFSMQKFSSNVVEKALQLAPRHTRRSMIEELLNPEIVQFLMRDQFANYVLQRIVLLAESAEDVMLVVQAILPHVKDVMLTHPSSIRRLVAQICKHDPCFADILGVQSSPPRAVPPSRSVPSSNS